MTDHSSRLNEMPTVILTFPLPDLVTQRLGTQYHVESLLTPAARQAYVTHSGNLVRAIVTNGSTRLDGAFMDTMPNLCIIHTFGVGYEGVDVDAARARGIEVAYSPGTNADSVADQAFALLLAVMRDIVPNDGLVRQGAWRPVRPVPPQLSGQKIGILGMGHIGQRIAARAAGFSMPVFYYSRRPRNQAQWTYCSSVMDMAARVNVLAIALPGGPETCHLVDADVLQALGPQGYVVNVGRGSVISNTALSDALEKGIIAGAGLDVTEGEPDVPATLREQPNIVFSPHVGARSPQSLLTCLDQVMTNLHAALAGRSVHTPVP
ncbi:2-hydroxyacid dehydrogenase [Komagataeibacter intermedius AF2]|uniref:2-hydroxyacid dehydrogenase n=1 Tax=Komagataeibacter intermedius AF2 TaxID=1458464 RepID=A0A0N0MFR9_9PROT|nr:2-hydroxyacid dehydrogenase [Komagataeibacter intermedius]KPH87903.1 2-hydroxyacid dehydrogenase [Komagataeibacter intermedius AF2]